MVCVYVCVYVHVWAYFIQWTGLTDWIHVDVRTWRAIVYNDDSDKHPNTTGLMQKFRLYNNKLEYE